MNILYITSKEFFKYTVISLLSLLENNKKSKNIVIYLYCQDVSKKGKNILKQISEFYNCKIISEFDPINVNKLNDLIIENQLPDFNGCNYTYAKILPNILLPDLNKLIVIDVDTLILEDLQNLYNTNIDECYVAAVPELLANYVSSEDPYIIKRKAFYYNTGVLLFNIKKMNSGQYCEKIIEAYKNYRNKLKLADQSLLNLALDNTDVKPIDFRYNYNNNCNISKILRKRLHKDYKKINLLTINNFNTHYKNIAILHFVGNLKPWGEFNFTPYRKLYKQYAKKAEKFGNYTYYSNRHLFANLNIIKLFDAYINFIKYKSFFDKKIKNKNNKDITTNIFSIKNSNDKRHKIITVLGFKIKLKRKIVKYASYEEISNATTKILKQEDITYSGITNRIAGIISEELPRYLAVQKLHNKTFNKFKFKHHDDNIIIIGCGPSVRYYKNQIKGINIALNRALFLDEIDFAYMFAWDYKGFLEKTPSFFEDVKKYKNCIKFYGKFLNPKMPSIPDFPDDENNNIRHFYSCKRWGLQAANSEVIIYTDIDNYPMADFMSVSFPAIQFALYTHPRKLYLVGLDTVQAPNCAGIDNPYDVENMKRGYLAFKQFAELHYPNIEIISINPVGLKGMFKDVYTQSYVDEHPELLNEDIEIIDIKEKVEV